MSKKSKKERLEDANRNNLKNFKLKEIKALTVNQALTFDAYFDGKNLLLHGSAGTGKTFISLFLALSDILSGKSKQSKITLVRSAVPTRDVGFLPGTLAEKIAIYEAPYKAVVNELFGRADAYDILKQKEVIEFMSTSFIRGLSIHNSIIIIDEATNLNFHELDSIITRIGKNSRIIFCGDMEQSDIQKNSEKDDIEEFLDIIEKMESFARIDFKEVDIVRSGLVKEYLLTKNRYYNEKNTKF